jgi:hypothetical protein
MHNKEVRSGDGEVDGHESNFIDGTHLDVTLDSEHALVRELALVLVD